MRRVGIAIASLISLAAYLALSIVAWGSWNGFFANPARLGLALGLLAAWIAVIFTDSSGIGGGEREDKSNRWVIAAYLLVGLGEAWLPAYLDRRNEWVWGGDSIRWVGLAVSVAAGWLRMAPVFALGRRFSGLVAIQRDHELKTDGIYSVIRHPSYLGLILGTFGWTLVFRGLALGVIFTAVIAMVTVARMNSEEKLLLDQFKDEYAAYRRRTWRLAPWVY